MKWTARINSVLDLVAFAPPSQSSTVSELKDALAESDLPFLVDLHIWDDVPKRFHEIIFKEYVVVQEAKEKTEVAFSPKDWETVILGDLGRVVTGKTPLTAIHENFGGQIPFVTPSDMDGRKTISTTARNLIEAGAASVKGSKIPAGSVMVSCIGSDMGKAVIAGRDCVSNQQINSIIVDDRFSSEFVYYNLSTRKDEIRHQAAGGSAQPILNKGHFSRLEITLPPLAEQKTIAAVLGALDDKIELNRHALGQFAEHPRVAALRDFITGWYVSYLSADSARGQPEAGPQDRLSRSGDNLANVIQYLAEQHPLRLERIFEVLRQRVPRIESVFSETMPDGRLLLQIKDAPFSHPVLTHFASDGTLKMLAYLVMLNDPLPPPLHRHRRAGELPSSAPAA